MGGELLLREFEKVAEAPGGVDRLRGLVLRLAMSGSLTRRVPSEGTGTELLARIDEERKRCEAAGILRPTKLGPDPDEPCGATLSSWTRSRLGRIVYVEMGQSPSSKHYNQNQDGIPFFQGKADFGGLNPTPRYWCTSPTKLAEQGDVLLSVRAPVGPANVAIERACIGRGLAALRPLANMPTMFVYWLTVSLDHEFQSRASGTTFVAIGKNHVLDVPVLLPPLPEQHRIVARVDQLMALCDQLEAKQQQRRQVALALPKALYTPLTTAEAPTERRTAWHRVRRSFDDLTILPEQIPALRQTILELAVRGRLVEQDPGDSPSCMAHDPSIEGRAGLPNPLPLQWKAARLGSLGNWFGGGTPSKRNDAYWNGEIPWVSPKDMKRLQIGDSIDHVTSQALEETSVKLIPKGSLLMVVRGMILAKNFPVAVTTGPVTLNQDMKALVPKIPGISDFLLLVLQAHRSLVMELVETSTHGTCRLGTARLQGVAIPIPPPAEQGRIVARVAFLMGLCNQVEGLARGRLQCQELLVRALASGR